MNQGAVIPALGRFVRWQVASRLSEELEIPWFGGARFALRRGMTGATGNIYCGLHEYMDMAFVLHLLQPGDLLLDVGANIGSFTLLASKVCGARTIAFEPGERAPALRKNIALNHLEELVTLHEVAVGDKPGVADFTLGNDAQNRLCADGEAGIPVQVITLDSLATRPTLIKIDVEGGEEAVFRGGLQTISHALAILTEGMSPYIAKALDDAGFQRRGYDPKTRQFIEPGTTGNALFIRDEAEVRRRVASAPRRQIFQTTI